jgi:predicted O-methyltransferase YrrM
MRKIGHWSPRYVRDRILRYINEKLHPEHPWLTITAIGLLDQILKPSDIGIEFGSGRSTVWFAKRLTYLTSVEHSEKWYEQVKQMLAQQGFSNVDYHLCPKDKDIDEAGESAYVRVLESFEENSIDFVLVDGIYRDFCTQKVLNIIRSGGILVIDNVERYLPSTSRSPEKRTTEQGAFYDRWDKIYEDLTNWRQIWTSDGVADTAIFIKSVADS